MCWKHFEFNSLMYHYTHSGTIYAFKKISFKGLFYFRTFSLRIPLIKSILISTVYMNTIQFNSPFKPDTAKGKICAFDTTCIAILIESVPHPCSRIHLAAKGWACPLTANLIQGKLTVSEVVSSKFHFSSPPFFRTRWVLFSLYYFFLAII